MIPILNRIAMFSARKRESDRRHYIMEYVGRSEKHKSRERDYYSRCNEDKIFTDTDIRLLSSIDDGSKRAESFLTLASSGGLVALVSIYQNEERVINLLALSSAASLIVAFFLISVLRVQHIQQAHFRYGEWWKNRLNYIQGEIDLAELAWRTRRTMDTPVHHSVLALISLIMVVCGYVLLFLSFYQRTP